MRKNFVRERVERGEICVIHIAGEENVADMYTKPLPVGKFVFCRERVVGDVYREGEKEKGGVLECVSPSIPIGNEP